MAPKHKFQFCVIVCFAVMSITILLPIVTALYKSDAHKHFLGWFMLWIFITYLAGLITLIVRSWSVDSKRKWDENEAEETDIIRQEQERGQQCVCV